MGIPRLSQWLVSTFPDAFEIKSGQEADHVYVDLNSILHDVLTGLGRTATERSFFAGVCSRLDTLFMCIEPRKSIFIAVDGPAAAAKFAEQRRRRRMRLVAPIRQNRNHGRNRGKQQGCKQVDSDITVNMLTPGVPLMSRLSAALDEYCSERLGGASTKERQWRQGVKATVSGSDAAGEGEHKILLELLRNDSNCCQRSSETAVHVIVGTDSDLLLVPLGPKDRPGHVFVATPQRESMRDAAGLEVPAFRVCSVDAIGRLGCPARGLRST
eukprot:TRINITY_DN30299_c0_g2_i1.p1 TRINITY_DN30299_c0_g2~~TRINITY_DN30299_c0_g2_i1.p1  ORF type:complete len:287 (-),score=43.90 TRINITY_DN30299_c0_g2_i1:555-1364(-)